MAAVAAAVGWGAAWIALQPGAGPVDQSAESVTVEVVEVTVGRSINVSVTVAQPVAPLAANALSGVVTAIRPAPTNAVGDEVFAVAGTPVRVVTGAVPFYRDLARTVVGDDVRQLQQALVDLGYTGSPPSGTFTAETEAAVRAWQRASGNTATGTIRLGELVAVPSLPASLRLGDDIVLGAVLSGGEDTVLARTGEQRFEIIAGEDQVRLIPADAAVRVRFGDLEWIAAIAQTIANEDGNIVLTLVGAGGAPVCGADCASLPGDEQLTLPGEAVVVPEVSGPAVPTAAVLTDTDASTYVVLANGQRVDVTVLGSGQGMAVLDGVRPGQRVLIGASATPESAAPVEQTD